MKTIEIEEKDYEAIAGAYGDFEQFIREAAAKAREKPASAPPSNFYEAASQGGLLSGGSDAFPPDLSTNPKHLEGLGR